MVKECIIQGNKAIKGHGIYTSGGTINLINNTITQNQSTSYSPYGGGINVAGAATNIFGGTISGNTAAYGGGICVTSGTAYADGVTISGNTGSSRGGGLYMQGGAFYGRNITISGNETGTSGYGGGISGSGGYCYLTDVDIKENTAGYGGAVALMVDSNLAVEISDGSDPSVITDNKAGSYGGAFYINGGTLRLHTAGTLKNQAGTRGSSVYQKEGNLYLYSGTLAMQDSTEAGTAESTPVYNVYVERPEGCADKFYLDPTKVKIEGIEDGEDPDVIYLESPDSYLSFIANPPADPGSSEGQADASGFTLPITLNTENFEVGSVVAKPVNGTYTFSSIPERKFDESTGAAEETQNESPVNVESTCDKAYVDAYYNEGSVTPFRTHLGGMYSSDTSENVNLVLLGDGVYLGGSRAKDKNDGTSPTTAVETFERAYELLEQYVEDAEKEGDDYNDIGFAPFIYICGKVNVDEKEYWNIAYESEPFKNSRYEEYERGAGREPEPAQIKRFASFVNAPMITIDSSGSIEAETLIINGMREGVVTSDQQNKSPIFDIKRGTLELGAKAVVRNNYYNLINMNGGTLTLTGAGEETDEESRNSQLEINGFGYGVYANDAKIIMQNGAQILMQDAAGHYVSEDNRYQTTSGGSYWQCVIMDNGSSMTMTDSFPSAEGHGRYDKKRRGYCHGRYIHQRKQAESDHERCF